jgi:hypothetical protein
VVICATEITWQEMMATERRMTVGIRIHFARGFKIHFPGFSKTRKIHFITNNINTQNLETKINHLKKLNTFVCNLK